MLLVWGAKIQKGNYFIFVCVERCMSIGLYYLLPFSKKELFETT